MSVAKRLGLLKASTSALFLCDMQVKFAPNIAYFPQIVKNSKRVFGAAQVMDLPGKNMQRLMQSIQTSEF